ncbi:MAG TPA: Gfo/Idh/MocA family oxidoreductase [Symbiobacteriaceae bacterium]|nr:Gfo/Idh/MocA family oxidoreductase [Symbiobacteriaceae bacterium]
MKRLRVGIAGCGEVTQIIHLPALQQLNDSFEVTALCDVSPAVLNGVGDLWRIPRRYTDYRDLAAEPTVDVVLAANPDAFHAATALAALAGGKHVLIEKPMCITPEEVDQITAERDRTGLTVQVGYMRRYAPAFTAAVDAVKRMKAVRLARVHDVIGRNSLIIEQTSRVMRGNDVPAEVLQQGQRARAELIRRAIGEAAPEEVRAYGMLMGLASHDLSAMREMLGLPQRVLYAAFRQGGATVTAAFDYGDFVCQFEMSVDNLPRYNTYIEVAGDDQTIRVDWAPPYVRHLPVTVTEQRTTGTGIETRELFPGWDDPFVKEWQALYLAITEGAPTKCGPEDYRHDADLFLELIRAMRSERSR